MLHISLSLINRFNKTWSAIFISLFCFGCSREIDFLPEWLEQFYKLDAYKHNYLKYYKNNKTQYHKIVENLPCIAETLSVVSKEISITTTHVLDNPIGNCTRPKYTIVLLLQFISQFQKLLQNISNHASRMFYIGI